MNHPCWKAYKKWYIRFASLLPTTLVNQGSLAKSTPVKNALEGLILLLGKDYTACINPLSLILKHRIHEWQTCLIRVLAFNGPMYFCCMEANKSWRPACNRVRCSRSISRRVILHCAGSKIGCFISKIHGASWNLSPTLSISFSSRKRCNWRKRLVRPNSRLFFRSFKSSENRNSAIFNYFAMGCSQLL